MERKYYEHRSQERVREDGFICAHCGMSVPGAGETRRGEPSGGRESRVPAAAGTSQRNHCPHCLHSRHVDLAVGDRRSLCGGIMSPISLWIRDDGEVALIHRCRRCGTIRANRVAGDDNEAALAMLAAPLLRASGSFARPVGAAGPNDRMLPCACSKNVGVKGLALQ